MVGPLHSTQMHSKYMYWFAQKTLGAIFVDSENNTRFCV